MIAYRCDRCNGYYENYNDIHDERGGGTVNSMRFQFVPKDGQAYGRKIYDLCPDCMYKLLDFMGGAIKDAEQISCSDNKERRS